MYKGELGYQANVIGDSCGLESVGCGCLAESYNYNMGTADWEINRGC